MSLIRVLLIGGPSHTGKSTLAETLAAELGWNHVSTDSMARHPGRPWRTDAGPVPDHVVHPYSSLSVDDLVEDVMRHYNSMWPDIESLVRTHVTDRDADSLVLEGSAVLPGRIATAGMEDVAACWLTADDEVLEGRIHASSDFDRVKPDGKALIQMFVQRNQSFAQLMTDAVTRHGLNSIDTGAAPSIDELIDKCVGLLVR
jgi:2-phosphoglycerate kinase